MNFEETQRVKTSRIKDQQAKVELEDAKALEKKKEALNFLKTRRIFKDLLDSREETFKQCKDFMLLDVLLPQVGGNDLVDAHFVAGYRIALETFEQVLQTYKRYEKEYGMLNE